MFWLPCCTPLATLAVRSDAVGIHVLISTAQKLACGGMWNPDDVLWCSSIFLVPPRGRQRFVNFSP